MVYTLDFYSARRRKWYLWNTPALRQRTISAQRSPWFNATRLNTAFCGRHNLTSSRFSSFGSKLSVRNSANLKCARKLKVNYRFVAGFPAVADHVYSISANISAFLECFKLTDKGFLAFYYKSPAIMNGQRKKSLYIALEYRPKSGDVIVMRLIYCGYVVCIQQQNNIQNKNHGSGFVRLRWAKPVYSIYYASVTRPALRIIPMMHFWK